jgi:hypothetical protein
VVCATADDGSKEPKRDCKEENTMALPTFAQAARAQYLHSSFYTVWLVGPAGEREYLGSTQRKSGTGLRKFLRDKDVQERVSRLPDAASATYTKRADRLEFSNGWRIEFGGTIRQEASAA